MAKRRSQTKSYNKAIDDSLRILFTHITSIEQGVGFHASQKATDYADMMKTVYSAIGTLHKDDYH